jgi:hypothetical protein
MRGPGSGAIVRRLRFGNIQDAPFRFARVHFGCSAGGRRCFGGGAANVAPDYPGSCAPAVTPEANVRAPSSKSYKPVAVKFAEPIEDASFATFRNELAAVAKRRIYAELDRLVMVQGFFWDRDFNGAFDRKHPAVNNLAAAIRLEHRNGMGWDTLAVFAAEPTATAFTGRPGIVCAPGEISFDDVEFDRLVDDARSKPRDWIVPHADKTVVRTAPRGNATVIDTLGLTLVRLLGFLTKNSEPDTMRTAWARVITPAGKTGYVAPGALMSPSPERLCYGKDGFGRWRIAGYVGAAE